ncbi:hypothetical protein GUJ93_ZPchr0002g25446 [Zizania palustris]|uniref:Uncharacterized protein n=1 Tax=Zizania palustris TaxID=103762 RepID=A0A8J5S7X6_ZIZPA|nr:hypothetical protein GUJ93_ZPchr0002g25446 [Zizania palustris]
MQAPASAARYVPLVAPAAAAEKQGEGEEDCCCYVARAGYVPLRGRWTRRDEHEEYAARRALFLQSYRLSASSAGEEADGGEDLQWLWLGRAARRMRDGVARAASRTRGAARWWFGAAVARAWRLGLWRRPRALGCFGGHGRKLHYLHTFA